MSQSWIGYWEKQDLFKSEHWEKGMDYFLRQTEEILHFTLNDVVLDVGCGPGNLASRLSSQVKEIWGVDTSQRYIEECKTKFKSKPNCHWHLLDINDYTNLSFLPEKKFTLGLCVSVVQYYKSLEDIKKLLQNFQRASKPGARFLIADIPMSSKLVDVLGFLLSCLKEGYVVRATHFIYKLLTSEYKQFKEKLGFLEMKPEELLQVVEELGLRAEYVQTPLTLSVGRKHLLIYF